LAANRTAIVLEGSEFARNGASVSDLFTHARQALEDERKKTDAALLVTDPTTRREAAENWFEAVSSLTGRFQGLRLTLLGGDANPMTWTSGTLLRYYSSLFSDAVSRNQALLAVNAAQPSPPNSPLIETAERNAARAELALELLRERASSTASGALQSIAELERQYRTTVEPVGERIMHPDEGVGVSPAAWFSAVDAMLESTSRFQGEVLEQSRMRLASDLERARQSIVLWSLLGLIGVLCVVGVVYVVQTRIVIPLERLVNAMLRLAEDDVAARIPRLRRDDEIGAMNAALRVFKANAIRRLRLEHNRNALLDRLKETYRLMRRDLQAAASVQLAMLPQAGTRGGVRFCSLFRPATVVAGDTFNLLELGEGRVGFFMVDVAGHGAAAALVSASVHSTLSQWLVTRDRTQPLSLIGASINAYWPDDLPYFTMILGELDVSAGRLSVVQAGHPPPIVVSRDGDISRLGSGGLPIGLVGEVEHEQIDSPFEPGDRLVVYSDGLIEAESPDGRPYSEERLIDLVRQFQTAESEAMLKKIDADVRSWRASKALEDDLSVLVLQRT
jgi:serine phosphatase RsbU (regulator of sigma subunit)